MKRRFKLWIRSSVPTLLTMRLLSIVAALTLLVGSAHAVTYNSVFDPTDFTALDSGTGLTMGAGDSITFNTDTLQITGTIGGSVVSFGNGVAASSSGGGVELSVFTFNSIDIGTGASVSVAGNRGLVLASQADFTLSASIAGLAGSSGSTNGVAGLGGSGAEGGVAQTSYASNPPGSTRGNGGNGAISVDFSGSGATAGVGYGGGGVPLGTGIEGTERGGGGGAYGGIGGDAPNNGGAGGVEYGDATLTELYGGSGGGGSQRQSMLDLTTGGGGGGGALELVASNRLIVGADLSLYGGNGGSGTNVSTTGGGGGSGGGVILAADWVTLNGVVDVSGGDGGAVQQNSRTGGGGSGGRVAVYADALTAGSSDPLASVDLSGGAAFGDAMAGADGTYYHGLYMFDAATNLVAVEDAHVATGNLGADRDNNYGSNTTLELKHGIESNDYTRKAYVKFDLNGETYDPNAEAIFKFTPVEYTGEGIDSGTLEIFALNSGFVAGDGLVTGVDELGFDWAEGDLIWDNAPANTETQAEFDALDVTSLGTIDFEANDSTDLGKTLFAVLPNLSDFLQSDGTVTLMIAMKTQEGTQVLRIASSEYGTVDYRPQLELSVVVPEPATWVLGMIALAGLALLRVRRKR